MKIIRAACTISIILCASVRAESDPIDEQKELYNVRMSQAINLHADQMAQLADQYSQALEGSAAVLQEKGDLDGLLALKAEIQRFKRSGKVPAESPKDAHPSVVKLQKIYTDSKAVMDATKGNSTSELTTKYLAYLGTMQKKLTQQGKLEQALQVKAEVERATRLQADMPEPTAKPAAASNPDSLLASWNQNRPRELPMGCTMAHQGGNGLANDGSISLKGGRTVIEGLNDKLLEACMQSNALSLIVHFQTDSLKQAGPARIFSFSENGTQRNFSLCQENDQLILRLRTTKTGDNGTNPQVRLGAIQEGKLHRVALTYQPGKLSFAMDGKAIPVQQIEGDFSNWQACQIVLGNEWKDDRSWKGSIQAFAIYSSALPERDAIALTR